MRNCDLALGTTIGMAHISGTGSAAYDNRIANTTLEVREVLGGDDELVLACVARASKYWMAMGDPEFRSAMVAGGLVAPCEDGRFVPGRALCRAFAIDYVPILNELVGNKTQITQEDFELFKSRITEAALKRKKDYPHRAAEFSRDLYPEMIQATYAGAMYDYLKAVDPYQDGLEQIRDRWMRAAAYVHHGKTKMFSGQMAKDHSTGAIIGAARAMSYLMTLALRAGLEHEVLLDSFLSETINAFDNLLENGKEPAGAREVRGAFEDLFRSLNNKVVH